MAQARLLGVAPGMPTTDMERTVRHYAKLGFAVTYPGEEFSILERDGVELHFGLSADHDPQWTAAWIYVRVSDAAALHGELRGVEGVRELRTTDYFMREFAYLDPDNNQILFGSRLEGGAEGAGS